LCNRSEKIINDGETSLQEIKGYVGNGHQMTAKKVIIDISNGPRRFSRRSFTLNHAANKNKISTISASAPCNFFLCIY